MELWSAATTSEAGPWWWSALIGFIGAVVGAGATLVGGILSDRRKAQHADAQQWDKEIVQLAQRLLTSVETVLDGRPAPDREVPPEQERAFLDLCDAERTKQKAILGQLELIAPTVRARGLDLHNACFKLSRVVYTISSDGAPVLDKATWPEVQDLIKRLVAETRRAIRLPDTTG